MGIKGLLPLLDPIAQDFHIQQYSGKKVAVDGHCWLHRGVFGCAYELAMGLETEKYVSYFMHMVQMLLFYKVIPIIVFDGQTLPMKDVTTTQRKLNRQKHLREGEMHAAKGNKDRANKSFQQAISITEKMIYAVIKALDKAKVKYVIAPFEADPQLTYMMNNGQVDAVITEDSDLLTFGCKKVIYKLNRYGEGRQILHKDIFTSEKLRMTKFTPDMFRYMCITSGCDYLPSLFDVGLKKAHGYVERHPSLEKLFHLFHIFRAKHIVEPYIEKFLHANAAFLYQFVFDMNTKTYTRLNPVPKDMNLDHLSLLGQSPQDCYIPLLRANRAIILPKLDYRETNKENIDPLADYDEFDEFKFDDTTLKQVEDLLQKVEAQTTKKINRPALGDKTNITAHPVCANKNKRKLNCQDNETETRAKKAIKKMSDRDVSSLVFAAMRGDKEAIKKREQMLVNEYLLSH